MKLAINHQTRVSLATYRAEELLRSGAIGELVGVRIVDKGQRPSGNSLMEMATHLFDHTRLYAGDPAWVSAHLTTPSRSRMVVGALPPWTTSCIARRLGRPTAIVG